MRRFSARFLGSVGGPSSDPKTPAVADLALLLSLDSSIGAGSFSRSTNAWNPETGQIGPHNNIPNNELLTGSGWTKQANVTITQISGGEWEIDLTNATATTGIYYVATHPSAMPQVASFSAKWISGGDGTIQVYEPVNGAFTGGNKILTTDWQDIVIPQFTPLSTVSGVWIRKNSGGANIIRVKLFLQNNYSRSEYFVNATDSAPVYGPRYVSGKQGQSILIEEASTQLLTNTQDLSGWGFSSCTLGVTGNYWGSFAITKFTEDTAIAAHGPYFSWVKAASAITYTLSVVFPSTNGRSNYALRLGDGTNYVDTIFNITNGTVVQEPTLIGSGITIIGRTITAVGTDKYRCTVTLTSNSATTWYLNILGAIGFNISYTGTSAVNQFVAPMLEALSYATSPVIGGAAGATRGSESLSYPTSGALTAAQGTIMAWVKVDQARTSSANVYCLWSLRTAGGGNDNIVVYGAGNSLSAYTSNHTGTASTHPVGTALVGKSGWVHIAMTWSSTELALWVDGVKQATPTANPNIPSAVDSTFQIGYDTAVSGWQPDLPIDQFRVFGRPLTAKEIGEIYKRGL